MQNAVFMSRIQYFSIIQLQFWLRRVRRYIKSYFAFCCHLDKLNPTYYYMPCEALQIFIFSWLTIFVIINHYLTFEKFDVVCCIWISISYWLSILYSNNDEYLLRHVFQSMSTLPVWCGKETKMMKKSVRDIKLM